MAAQKTASRPGWATPQEASDYTGFKVSTLRKWRCTGEGPEFTGKGHGVRYPWRGLDAFMASRRK